MSNAGPKPSNAAPRRNHVLSSKPRPDAKSLDKHSVKLFSLNPAEAAASTDEKSSSMAMSSKKASSNNTEVPETTTNGISSTNLDEMNIGEDEVPKNEFGGVLVTPEDIMEAFKVLDHDGIGHINLNTLTD